MGVLTATVLDRLVERVPDLLARVDLFAGTSTGALIALALAKGRSPAELVDLYRKRSAKIFEDSALDDIRDLGRLLGADHDSSNLRSIVADVLGSETKLSQLGRRVLVAAFDLDNGKSGLERSWKPKFFHNLRGPDSDGDEKAVDVALRSCAAPTYLPTYQGYIDGGVVANNPSMAALALVLDRRNGTGVTLDDVSLLSLGTGTLSEFIEGQELDWGISQWARPLIRLMLDGNVGIADFQCAQLLNERYMRFSPVLPARLNVELDGVHRVEDLYTFARTVSIEPLVEWIQTTWRPDEPASSGEKPSGATT